MKFMSSPNSGFFLWSYEFEKSRDVCMYQAGNVSGYGMCKLWYFMYQAGKKNMTHSKKVYTHSLIFYKIDFHLTKEFCLLCEQCYGSEQLIFHRSLNLQLTTK